MLAAALATDFHQTSASTSHDYLEESFGLIDTSRERWTNLRKDLTRLNDESDDDTLFKVLFLGRHGQGWHNVAEQRYGSPEWNSYWSKVNTDGNMTWGPDAQLTPLGENQARRVHRAWKRETLANAPAPPVLYSSPLSRAASTCEITYEGLGARRPVFMEELRETIGVHTCDKRHSKTWMSAHYPRFVFAEPFEEKDVLWSADERETDDQQDARSRKALDYIFSHDSPTYIAITAHGGTIASLLRVVQHPRVQTQTGSVTPVIVKARRAGRGQKRPIDNVGARQRVFDRQY
ncbi:phosphoglycerate mutase-like protein [Rhodotorula sp. JG-1b]|nr:phosphoglycerate mutase-like protein [Rhodotorula sp. JG-1b]